MTMISVDRVMEASSSIPRPFVQTPQFRSESLSGLLGIEVILKVETVNPAGSVMGRAAEWWFRCNPNAHRVICPSAGDFGAAMGFAARARGVALEVFGSLDSDQAKVDALRHAGTHVRVDAADADGARAEADAYAGVVDAEIVEDGVSVELVEGLATMAAELEQLPDEPQVVYVPLGVGTLAAGTGAWCHRSMPRTRVIGVGADGAPAMARSVTEHRVVSTPSADTAAHELAVRTPNAELVGLLSDALDDVRLVTDVHLGQAAAALESHEGLRVSLSGAATLAAAALDAASMAGATVVVPVTSRRIG